MDKSKQELTVRSVNAQSNGTTTANGSVTDATGYEAAIAYLAIGAISSTGTVTLKLQHGNESDGSDMADITGASASLTDADDSKLAIVEKVGLTKRYVRPVVVRETSGSVIDSCVLRLNHPKKVPVTQDSTVASHVVVN